MATIAFTAAACKLAQAIYHARAEAYGIAVEPWELLTPRSRDHYVDEAALTLESVKPLPVLDFPTFLLKMGADAMRKSHE